MVGPFLKAEAVRPVVVLESWISALEGIHCVIGSIEALSLGFGLGFKAFPDEARPRRGICRSISERVYDLEEPLMSRLSSRMHLDAYVCKRDALQVGWWSFEECIR